MEEYLRSTVHRYEKLMIQHHGKAPQMLKVPTPFLPEDHKDSEAGKQIGHFPATICPFCDASFPIAVEDQLTEDGVKLVGGREIEKSSGGELPFLGKIYYSEKDFPMQKAEDVKAKALAGHGMREEEKPESKSRLAPVAASILTRL